ELALVRRLDLIRQRRATWGDGNFDYRTAARDYAGAFQEAGLGKVGDDPEAMAARVRTSPAAAAPAAAPDDWAVGAGAPATPEGGGEGGERGGGLVAGGGGGAPAPWGDRFRDPAVWRDRRALQALADEALKEGGAKLSELSPQVLDSLGGLLFGRGADPVPLLR